MKILTTSIPKEVVQYHPKVIDLRKSTKLIFEVQVGQQYMCNDNNYDDVIKITKIYKCGTKVDYKWIKADGVDWEQQSATFDISIDTLLKNFKLVHNVSTN